MEQPYEYIRVNAIYDKLKKSECEGYCLYIHAPVGLGKTAAVRNYFKGSKCLWLNGMNGELDEMPSISDITEKAVVIDDISWLTDDTSIRYICSLVADEKIHLVLIGRSRFPSWLTKEYTARRFMQADEWDLLLNQEQAEAFLEKHGYSCSAGEPERIMRDNAGFVPALILMLPHLIEVGEYNQTVLDETKIDIWHYYDDAFFRRWSNDAQTLLLSVAEFDTFDAELAKILTGNPNIVSLIEYVFSVGDFLAKTEDGKLYITQRVKEYLMWKQRLTWRDGEWTELHKRAAIYFECQGDISSALSESKKIGDHDRVESLLIKNSKNHPGVGEYYTTKEYYFSLPEEVLMKSPVLIAGMSMLYALLLNPEKSEEWYNKLVEYKKANKSDAKKLHEAKTRLAVLDITLPQRGIKNIVDILKKAAALSANREIIIPELSVTGNQPSIMNGGKDFCEWSRHDKELAVVMSKPIEIVLGKSGVGLVDISLAESFFEKASAEDYEIMSLLNSGYAAAEAKGSIEICFAAIGIQSRLKVFANELAYAEQLLDNFGEKIVREKAQRLLPNFGALRLQLEMRHGNIAAARKWVNTAPNEIVEFFTLDRYRYLTKLRCYIMLEEYEQAISLSQRLDYYYVEYDRNYMKIENLLLRAICCYRTGAPQWRELFEEAYRMAESFHFVRVISWEGIAVLPLLKLYYKDKALTDYDRLVKRKAEYMAYNFPKYLAPEKKLEEPLTEMERGILQLHSSGMSTREIMELCDITERTLKFHNSNIYRKLDVSGKSEAIRIGVQLGLIN